MELLLVVAIMAIALGGVLSMTRPSATGARMKATAYELAAKFRAARATAVTRRSQQLVLIDLARKTVWRDNGRKISSIAAEIGLKVTSARSERLSSEVVGVRFFPNGSSTGATLTLFQEGLGYEIRVNWLTGYISVAQTL